MIQQRDSYTKLSVYRNLFMVQLHNAHTQNEFLINYGYLCPLKKNQIKYIGGLISFKVSLIRSFVVSKIRFYTKTFAYFFWLHHFIYNQQFKINFISRSWEKAEAAAAEEAVVVEVEVVVAEVIVTATEVLDTATEV